ncbi:zinc-binding dehydrogenase [Vibrio coralliilyticus]|uniref:zinc-binding dehydrogenase n=1 Tax=Vibrio coralliilyticus TaxID=190893 RepID=UPI0015612062|nr:zinc-binding dehydrogenase [Vibrio coralliilyticus]NRF29660.1 zinc-binding dehydrogenase [Vibrio coralliilyticus]NRF52188.1 zinc-binding dehydrogenase [Vibrio coralliilyticus]NRG06098.1 zinc-binding dehydrogenase [Vibrio coralliilyticus]
MKAITYQREQDTFTVSELPQPNLQSPFDVLVRVHAVALNPVDAKVNFWHGMVPDMNDNFVGGLDVSGEIVATGELVTGWTVGDRVLYHGNMRRVHGGFAEYALQDARTLTAHPNVPAEFAAATPCAAWTAYRALVDKLNIESRSSIFIAGGAGGVGSFAIQLAKHFGVSKIVTTASTAKHSYVKKLGATHVIDYRSDDVAEQIMNLTDGLGVDVALDCVGGDNDLLAASVLGFEGQMVELVKTVQPELYPDAFLKGLSFHQLSLGSGHVNGEKGRNDMVAAGNAVSKLFELGILETPALQVIPLDQVGDKLVEIRNQRTTGKIVAKLV